MQPRAGASLANPPVIQEHVMAKSQLRSNKEAKKPKKDKKAAPAATATFEKGLSPNAAKPAKK